MTKEILNRHNNLFEQIKQTDKKGNEYWSARDLSKVLEYSEYRHFLPVIERAKEACANSSQQVADHFEDILEMVSIGSGAQRKTYSVKLSQKIQVFNMDTNTNKINLKNLNSWD